MNKTPVVVIVDAYLSGTQIAIENQKRGWQSINVQSSADLPQFLLNTFRPELFTKHLLHDGNLETLVEALKNFSVSIVLPGAETGVVLAEQLAHRLGLKGNDPRSVSQ